MKGLPFEAILTIVVVVACVVLGGLFALISKALEDSEEVEDLPTPELRLVSDLGSRECEAPGECGKTEPACLPCRARELLNSRRGER